MAYADFTLSGIIRQFGLSLEEKTDLFFSIPEAQLRPEFVSKLPLMAALALKLSTEKARSELIIAPILTELWFLREQYIGFFSGVDFSVDPAQGLTGICDYLITKNPEQYFVSAPVIAVVEAKNEDMKRGYGQCAAEMLAAQTFNQREGQGDTDTFGVVTIGERWKFLKLQETILYIDAVDYYIKDLAKIMGILLHLTDSPALEPVQ